MEWISVKDKLPPSGSKIVIRTFDRNDNVIEIPAVFTYYANNEKTEVYGWNIGNVDTVARPTHWKLLDEAGKE